MVMKIGNIANSDNNKSFLPDSFPVVARVGKRKQIKPKELLIPKGGSHCYTQRLVEYLYSEVDEISKYTR